MQKKALLHKTFFSLRRGSVTCMVFICSYFVYLVSDLTQILEILMVNKLL